MFPSTGAPTESVSEAVSLEQVAHGAFVGEDIPSGARTVMVNRHGACAAVAVDPTHTRVAVVLDDRPQAFDDKHADAWRRWLRLSNSLALCDWASVVTTTSLVEPAGPGLAQEPLPGPYPAPADDLGAPSGRCLGDRLRGSPVGSARPNRT
jgi:hypothetical protein